MASTQMDRANCVPNSSTRYYKSQRCKFGIAMSSDEVIKMNSGVDHERIADTDGCDVVLDSDTSSEGWYASINNEFLIEN